MDSYQPLAGVIEGGRSKGTIKMVTAVGVLQWHVYGMALLLGILKAVDMPARQAFVIELVEGKEDLTSAIGLNSAIHNGAKTLGPALAGATKAFYRLHISELPVPGK